MKIYAKGTKVWADELNANLSTISDLIKKYEEGFSGIYLDPDERDRFTQIAIETGGYNKVEDAAHAYGWAESFSGQLVIPFVHVMELVPGAWPGAAQGRGDCFVGDTLVRMSDGSLKEIKSIEVGDYVIGASGYKRRVTNVFKKYYDKKLVKIKADGHYDYISCTPDHKFIVDQDTLESKAIASLDIGDEVYLPPILHEEEFIFDLVDFYDREIFTDNMDFKKLRIDPVKIGKARAKGSSIQVNRFISFDEKLSWLLGLYAAESGIDGDKGACNRITFNLGSHEVATAQQVKQYFIDIFGIEPYVYQVPSKPTVIYVRVSCSVLACFFSKLVKGNVYTKRLSNELLITTKQNKIALLKGYLDGDGHKGKYGGLVVSASKQLIHDFSHIANSIGINFSERTRPAYKRSKEAYTLNIHSQSATELMTEKTNYVASTSISSKPGRMVKIESIELVDCVDNLVYCIEVETDHQFICNGFGVNNCVSHSNKNALLGTLVGEVVAGQQDEVTGKLERIPDIPQLGISNGALSTEVSYWFRGSGGDGWYCGAAANVSIKSAGAVVRKNYPEIGIDLTKYSASLAGKWGRSKPPENIAKELRNNLIRTAARASTFEGLRDNLGQGRFISSCGSEGFSKKRDKNGFSNRSGSWAHAMGYIATDDRPEIIKLYGEPLVLILNSWGSNWNSGPRDIFDSAKFVPLNKKELWIALDIVNPETGNIMIPKGSFWAKWSNIKSRDCYVYAGLNGWEMQKIPTWNLDLWG